MLEKYNCKKYFRLTQLSSITHLIYSFDITFSVSSKVHLKFKKKRLLDFLSEISLEYTLFQNQRILFIVNAIRLSASYPYQPTSTHSHISVTSAFSSNPFLTHKPPHPTHTNPHLLILFFNFYLQTKWCSRALAHEPEDNLARANPRHPQRCSRTPEVWTRDRYGWSY